MDVLVEFCRTGELAPLRKGMTAAEVEHLLGPPRDIKWVHGDDNWQRYRYGSLSLMLMRGDSYPPDQQRTLSSITLSFRQLPFDLPISIAEGLVHPWTSSCLDDVITVVHAAGVKTTLEHESSAHGRLHQRFRAGQGPVSIVVFAGAVSKISG